MATDRECPECGSELIVRHGSFGQFIGCSSYPVCTYTKALSKPPEYERVDENTWREKKVKRVYSCNRCDGSGLIPFVNKEGKLIPHTFVDCECREVEHGYDREVQPKDFDFPMSYPVYRSLCQQHGWHDPGPCELSDDKPEVPVLPARNLTPKEWDELQQVKAGFLFLQDKLNKSLTKTKVAKQYTKYI